MLIIVLNWLEEPQISHPVTSVVFDINLQITRIREALIYTLNVLIACNPVQITVHPHTNSHKQYNPWLIPVIRAI